MVKIRQKAKFEQLRGNNQYYHTPHVLDRSKVILNFSNRALSSTEEDVLALGMNFSITPSRIPTADIIAAIEATAHQLDTTTAEQLRARVNRALVSAKLPKPNLSYRQQAALKNLRDDLSIVIIPADKGNATVVMDTTMYEDKMNIIVNEECTYKELKRNPTTRFEKKVAEAVRRLHWAGHI